MVRRERIDAIREFANRTDAIHNRQELLDLLSVIDEQQQAIDGLAHALDAIDKLRTPSDQDR